jgi:DNA-binding MarR family transcriptional regulator
MDTAAILQVRSFNRIVAERLGALHDRFLDRGRPMSESRILWEIGPPGAEVRDLRGRLGLDASYLSRVLRSLEDQGLVSVRSSPGDGRGRRAYLTEAGLDERAELDRRSNALALQILETLPDRQQGALTAAMGEVERLLQASMVAVAVEDPAAADAGWCFDQYFAELDSRFEMGFDPARSISADAAELTPPAGLLLIARLRG